MATATETRANGRSHDDGGDDFKSLMEKQATPDRADLLMMKMENESIMAECRLHPRNMSAVKRELIDQLDAFPELAYESIYNKPIGGGKETRGLSIRAAETLAEAYGYNRIRSDVTPLDLLTVKVEATYTDYQKGRVWQDGGILSKQYKQAKNKGGGTATYDDDRFYNVVCKAEVSKRIREVILRSINSGLKAWYEAECEKRIGELLTDDIIAKTVKGFEEFGVSVTQLETYVGRPRAIGWTVNDRTRLRALYQAIRDNETTVADAFGTMPPQGSGATTPSKSLDDLAGKKNQAAEADVPSEETDIDPVALYDDYYAKIFGTSKRGELVDLKGFVNGDKRLNDEQRASLIEAVEKKLKPS